VLLTRAPLYSGRSPFSLDLHVLGPPLTFALSQDQTLHQCCLGISSVSSSFLSNFESAFSKRGAKTSSISFWRQQLFSNCCRFFFGRLFSRSKRCFGGFLFSDFSVDVLLSPQLPGHWKQVLRCFLRGPGGNLVLPEGFPQIFPRNPFNYRPKTFVLLGFSLSEVFDTSSSGRRNIVLGPMESTWKKNSNVVFCVSMRFRRVFGVKFVAIGCSNG
jgi:hypothetical protein